MDKDIKFSPQGLWTAPSAVEAPRGGLIQADEITIRRKGVAEPRPGFSVGTLAAVLTAGSIVTPKRFIDYGSKYLVVGLKSTSSKYGMAWSNAVALAEDSTGRGDEAIFDTGCVQGLEVRKNLYLTTNDGPRKVSANTDTAAPLAGAGTVAIDALTTTTGNALEDQRWVAYSAVLKRTDANGVIFRSAPSGRSIMQNTSGSTKGVTLRVYLHKSGHVHAGDVVEVYRTLNETTSTPSNAAYLIGEVTVTSSDLTTGYIALTDTVPDDETGLALYTNDGEEGIEAAHIRPPAARCMEYFNGSLFLGRLAFPATQTFSYFPVLSGFAGTSEIGVHTLAGTFTNGSASVVVANSALFKVGQIFADQGSDWNSGTTYSRITAIPDGTHVTCNHTWAGSTGSTTRAVVDSIRVNSDYFPVFELRILIGAIKGTDVYPVSQSATQTAAAVDIDVITDDPAVPLFNSAKYFFKLTAVNAWDTPPVIYATNGAQYTPALPEPTATGYSLPVETQEESVAWSNNLEPEHFTAVNLERIGKGGSNVLALKATRNALIIFKEDGAFRLSGAGADSGFRIDELDKGLRLLTPDAAVSADDKVYAWCDQGVMEIDENGSENVSSIALKNTLHPTELSLGPGNYATNGLWCLYNAKDHEVVFAVPSTASANTGFALLVFNREQGAWVAWLMSQSLYHGIYHLADRLLYVGSTLLSTGGLRVERPATTQPCCYDAAYNATVTAVTGATVNLNDGALGTTLSVGDAFVQSSVRYIITSVAGVYPALTYTVHRSGIVTGAISVLGGYESVITPIGFLASGPQDLKVWGEGSVIWNAIINVYQYAVSMTSTLSETAVTQTRTITDVLDINGKPKAFRFVTPRRHARSERVYPAVKIRQAGSQWALEGVTLNVRVGGDRLKNKK